MNKSSLKYLIYFSCLISSTLCYAQKTETPGNLFGNPKPVTRAVVIGISDYQHKEIPDLKYAHQDAAAFAQFLQSKAGGALPPEQIKVMLNEKATNASMVAALDWLIEQTNENDECIIYFSGHGDVEIKTRRQLGFLLTWDSPPQAYMAGAFPLFYLEEIISTLSLDKKGKSHFDHRCLSCGQVSG